MSNGTGAAAIAFLLAARRSTVIHTKKLVKDAPWGITIFSIRMYVVVNGLRNEGFTDGLSRIIQAVADQGLFAATVGRGFTAAILSSGINNLPTLLIKFLLSAFFGRYFYPKRFGKSRSF